MDSPLPYSGKSREGPQRRRRLYVIAFVLAGLALGSAILLVSCIPKVFLAVGRTAPIEAEQILEWTGSHNPKLFYRNSDGSAIVVRISRSRAESLLNSLTNQPGTRYVYIFRQFSEQFSEHIDLTQLTASEQMQVQLASGTDVADASVVRIANPLFKFDLLASGTSGISNPTEVHWRSISLGPDLQFTIERRYDHYKNADSRVYQVRGSNGLPGFLSLYAEGNNIRADVILGSQWYSLTPLGGNLYAVLKRNPGLLPPDLTPKRSLPNPVSRATSAPASTVQTVGLHMNTPKCSQLKTDAFEIATNRVFKEYPSDASAKDSRIDIGLAVTPGAIRCLFPDSKSRPSRAEDIADALGKRISGKLTILSGEAFGQIPGTPRQVQMKFLQTGINDGDHQDMRKTLSQMCGPARSRDGDYLRAQMLRSRADVLVIIASHICKSTSMAFDPCTNPPEIPECPAEDLKQPVQPYCGTSTGIGVTNPESAVVILDAACIETIDIFHEIGHLLGAQHGDSGKPTDGVGYPTARAAQISYNLAEPNLSLMTSTEECPRPHPENCTYQPIWSSSDLNRKIPVVLADRKTVEYQHIGDSHHDNESAVVQGFMTAANFGAERVRSECKRTAESRFLVQFDFNVPRWDYAIKAWSPVDILTAQPNHNIDTANVKSLTAEELLNALVFYQAQCLTGNVNIHIEGHTDSVSGREPDYNDRLSVARADIVASFIAKNKLGNETLKVCMPTGFGLKKPFPRHRKHIGKAADRRVEVWVGPSPCPLASGKPN